MKSYIKGVPTLNGDIVSPNLIVILAVNKHGSEDQKKWTIDYRTVKQEGLFVNEAIMGTIPYSEENFEVMLMKMPQIKEIIDKGSNLEYFSAVLDRGYEKPTLVTYDRSLLSQLKEIEQKQKELLPKREAMIKKGFELGQRDSIAEVAKVSTEAIKNSELIINKKPSNFGIILATALSLAGLAACSPAPQEPTPEAAPLVNQIVIPKQNTVNAVHAMQKNPSRVFMDSVSTMTIEQKKALAESIGKELWAQIKTNNPTAFAVMGYQNYIDKEKYADEKIQKTYNPVVSDNTSTSRSLSEQECIEFITTMVANIETDTLYQMSDSQRSVYFREMYLIENMLISEATNPNNSDEKRVDIVEIIKPLLNDEEYELLKNSMNLVRNYKNSIYNIPKRYEITTNTRTEREKMAEANKFRCEDQILLSYANETLNKLYGDTPITYFAMNILSVGLEKMPKYTNLNDEKYFHTGYILPASGLQWQVRNENGQPIVHLYDPTKTNSKTCGWERLGPLSEFEKSRDIYNSSHSGTQDDIKSVGIYAKVCSYADMLKDMWFGECDSNEHSIWKK